MQHHNSQSGFTLIETTIYIALFVLIMAAVILTTYSMIASTDKSQYRSLIHNEAQYTIRKFNWVLNDASSVVVNGSSLTVNYPSGPPKVLSVSGSKLQVDGTTLNGDIAPISNVTFAVNPVAGTRPMEVQMSFRMNNIYYDETFTAKKFVR